MSTVFGERYSALYDSLYQDKDYVAECDLLERIFSEFGTLPVRDVLDLGCGTGGHAYVLAERGYEVVGVDRSLPMVQRARQKSQGAAAISDPTFHVADLREFRVDQSFNAVLMMFAVLGYQLEDCDVLSALKTARCQLRPGGLLAFDCWYGPAVDRQRPGSRRKIVATEQGRAIRTSSTSQDCEKNLCTVLFEVNEEGEAASCTTRETHPMRYFYRPELEAFLNDAGLELLRLEALPDFDRPADEESWNAMGVARVGGR